MRGDRGSSCAVALAVAVAILCGPAAALARTPPGGSGAGGDVWIRAATSPDITPTPPRGSGPEYTSYGYLPSVRNRFLVGGLLAWLGAMIGGLLLLDRRRMAALAIGGCALAHSPPKWALVWR
jgi:hypothetical protein